MEWIGLLELFIVLAFAAGWGVLELVGRRLDRHREAERAAREADAGD
jgi:hypothetical protein